jgi:hypothetical protein
MRSHSISTFRLVFLLLASTILISTVHAKSYKRIYVHTDATDDYLAQRSPDKPESYYFFKGIHFGGYVRDNSLRDVPFIDIAKGLAPHLAKQDYWPAQSKDTCDLLLVVNWGTTNPGFHRDVSNSILPDWYDGAYYDDVASGGYDESDYKWFGKQRNSKLLGFYPYLRWDRFTGISPSEEYELRVALKTERYFMIVTAFDFQELLENKEWKRVWSTRFNMRSPGTNFYKAHLALSKAGSPYYGKKLKQLGKENADFEPVIAEVEIGEIEVLETIDMPKGKGMLNSLRMSEQR